MTQRITKKFLEAQLLRCAKALGMGVVGIDPKECEEWGVPCARLVRAGEPHPRHAGRTAQSTGYYAGRNPEGSKGDPQKHLTIKAWSPGDGWTRYGVAVLVETDTAHHNDYPASPGGQAMTLSEFSAYLRGVEHGAHAMKENGHE